MIVASTGEIQFDDGLRITGHALVRQLLEVVPASQLGLRAFPVEGWRQHILGEHRSNFGLFAVEVIAGIEGRVEAAFLSHCHSFYEAATPDDGERRVFHEGVIAAELFGQREFSWGHVFCRLDREANRDWFVVIYNPFSQVPLHEREIYRALTVHEPPPDE